MVILINFLSFEKGSPELLQKTVIELAQSGDKSYVQRFTTGNEPTVDFPFVLGQHLERTMKGRTVEVSKFPRP